MQALWSYQQRDMIYIDHREYEAHFDLLEEETFLERAFMPQSGRASDYPRPIFKYTPTGSSKGPSAPIQL